MIETLNDRDFKYAREKNHKKGKNDKLILQQLI